MVNKYNAQSLYISCVLRKYNINLRVYICNVFLVNTIETSEFPREMSGKEKTTMNIRKNRLRDMDVTWQLNRLACYAYACDVTLLHQLV